MAIEGNCPRRFAPIKAALAANLAREEEMGEAVALAIGGEVVVDLWGGERAPGEPWCEDTLACMFSVGKPVAALTLLTLIDRGDVALDAPVTEYWPEYGQADKAGTTVDHVISHLAGVPGVLGGVRGSAYDWGAMVEGIERQPPLWAPGSKGCYHTFTYGHLVGEIVRRVTGNRIGKQVRETIADPLGVELGFGLSAGQSARCATLATTPGDPLIEAITGDEALIGRCWSALPLGPGEEDFNSDRFRAAEMPAFNGHASARALARLYSVLASGDGRP